MGETLISLIVQLLAGAIGGNVAGTALKDYSLGMLGNTITGAIGGGVLGQVLQVLQALLPSLAGTGGLDVGALLGQIAGGGAGGVILTVIAGIVKSAMAGPQVR
jgi:uncharacterized membrane protein YeaQ/YmgE (transglycosylase-associated protein family)